MLRAFVAGEREKQRENVNNGKKEGAGEGLLVFY